MREKRQMAKIAINWAYLAAWHFCCQSRFSSTVAFPISVQIKLLRISVDYSNHTILKPENDSVDGYYDMQYDDNTRVLHFVGLSTTRLLCVVVPNPRVQTLVLCVQNAPPLCIYKFNVLPAAWCVIDVCCAWVAAHFWRGEYRIGKFELCIKHAHVCAYRRLAVRFSTWMATSQDLPYSFFFLSLSVSLFWFIYSLFIYFLLLLSSPRWLLLIHCRRNAHTMLSVHIQLRKGHEWALGLSVAKVYHISLRWWISAKCFPMMIPTQNDCG